MYTRRTKYLIERFEFLQRVTWISDIYIVVVVVTFNGRGSHLRRRYAILKLIRSVTEAGNFLFFNSYINTFFFILVLYLFCVDFAWPT